MDEKPHNVYVFGTSLALIKEDGSTEISPLGKVGRVDAMIDGVVTTNVKLVKIPVSQVTRMVLEENSVIVKNVTAKDIEALKKKANDAYVGGSEGLNLAELGEVAAYKVNAKGSMEDASGKTVTGEAVGIDVRSTEAAYETFAKEVEESIKAQEEAAAAERKAEEARKAAEAGEVEAEKAETKESIEKKKESSSSSSSGSTCTHNWVMQVRNGKPYEIILGDCSAAACAWNAECTLCGKKGGKVTFSHNEDTYCEYCGCNSKGEKDPNFSGLSWKN